MSDGAISDRLYRVNGTTNKTGLAMAVKVMAGDVLNIYGKSYFNSTATFNNSNSTTILATDILNAFFGSPGSVVASKGLTSTDLGILNSGKIPATFIRGSNGESSSSPKAFVNYMFFDEQFRFVSGGFSRAGSSGAVKNHWAMDAALRNIPVEKNGYLYVYVSNESNIDVFFDNLQVIHTRGPVLEETHYYPFGLVQQGISSKAASFGAAENKYKYNGYEQNNDFDLNLYETFYRSHDPQIGRFWQIDPKPNEFVSPYAAMDNNPINFSDPLGDTIIFTQAFLATKHGQQIMELYKTSDAFKSMLSAYDIGGEGSFFGGEAGEYANNTNVVFDVINDTDEKGNSASGGGRTTMQVRNDKGEWIDVNGAKSGELTKDSKTRINILLNPDSKQSNTLQKAANITSHELTVHGAGFMNMSDILHSMSPKDFVNYRNAGVNVHFGDKSRNNILSNGYYNSNVQHAIVGAGLNGYYNAIRRQLNATLSKQGKSLLPNDAGSYQEELKRVQGAFKNFNQVTQLGIYGPAN